MIKFGEFAPDVAAHNVEIALVADNVIAGPNGYKSISGLTTEGIGTNTVPNTFSVFSAVRSANRDWSDTRTMLLGVDGSNNIKFYYNAAEFQQSSGLTYQTSFSDRFDVIRWGPPDTTQEIIIFGSVNKPQKIVQLDLNASSRTVDLGGSPPSANFATKVRDFIVTGRQVSYMNRVQWSGFDDHEEWTSGTNQSGFRDIEDAGRVMGVVGGEYGIVFMEKAIVRMNYIGTPSVWEFDPIEKERGTYAHKSIVQVGADIYYLGHDGFYVLKDGTTSIPIGANKVNKWFFRNSGAQSADDFMDNISGAYDRASNSVWWAFESKAGAGSTHVNDRVIIYDIATQRWSTATTDCDILFSLEPYREGSTDDYYRGANSMGLVKDDGTYRSALRFGDRNSKLAATIETGYVFDEAKRTSITGVRPIIDGPATVTIHTKADSLSDTEESTSATSVNSSGVANFRTSAKYHRIGCTTTGDFEDATGVVVESHRLGSR